MKSVDPVPELRVRFQQNNNRVDVLISYADSEAIIKVNGKVTGHLYIDPVYKKLAKLALTHFPIDRELLEAIGNKYP